MRYRAIIASNGFLGKHWPIGKITPHTCETPPVSKVKGPLFEALSDFETQLVDAKEGGNIGESYFSIDQQRLQKPKEGVNAKNEPEEDDGSGIKKAPGVGRWILPNGEKFRGSKEEAEQHWDSLQKEEEQTPQNGGEE